MASLFNNMNLEVLKVPLGFIRVVQLPFVIIAFASMSGWGVTFDYTATCAGNKTVPHLNIPIHTFKLKNVEVFTDSCTDATKVADNMFTENVSSSPGFFVFTGVVSMLFVLAMLGVYLFMWGKYESDNRFPILDLIVTAVLALFWFIGTICWWAGAVAVGSMTSKDYIQKELESTGHDKACALVTTTTTAPTGELPLGCTVNGVNGSYGSLVISVFAGWACVLLFVADCWFVYKETIWFRNRELPASVTGPNAGATSPYSNQQQPGGYS